MYKPWLIMSCSRAHAWFLQVNSDGMFRYAACPWFTQALQHLVTSGVYGVAVDVWVSLLSWQALPLLTAGLALTHLGGLQLLIVQC